MNTPRLITDSTGSAVWQNDNTEPFGNNVPNQDPNGTGNQFVMNVGYAGQYRDIETGTYYNGFRDCYDPATGRYCQSDPIGLLGGLNTYTYAANNPLKYTDRRGLDNPSMGPYGPYYAWTDWPEPTGQGIQPVCPECALPALRLAGWLKTISDLLKKEEESAPQACPKSFKKDQRTFPNRKLPRDKNGNPIPDPEAEGPYTQLGQRDGRNGPYDQAREFDENGDPVKDIDFTDHGRPQNHTDPHEHPYLPNPTGGTPQHGPAQPLQ